MGKKDSRIDAYIAEAADFAKPILKHLRKLVHEGCPQVEETMKWSHPFFMHKGVLCNMAAFKAHCAFGFWKGKMIFADDPVRQKASEEAMGYFGRLTKVSELPPDKDMLAYVAEAVRLNDLGIKKPEPPKSKERKELVVPDCLAASLKKNAKARKTFEDFSYSHKKEYIEWITEAKTDETRDRRLATTMEWLTAGKSRNWKYAKC